MGYGLSGIRLDPWLLLTSGTNQKRYTLLETGHSPVRVWTRFKLEGGPDRYSWTESFP